MAVSAREVQRKYEDRGLPGYLLGAIEFSINRLNALDSTGVLQRKEGGDIVTLMDRTVHDSFVNYFNDINIPVRILGEEGHSSAEKPEYAILIDEIEGTQNAINGLDYGINSAIAEYEPELTVQDLQAAVVPNLRDETIYVGERGKGAYKIIKGEEKSLDKKNTDVYECPSPWAYTTTPSAVDRQMILSKIFSTVIGNQGRSIDATGTRLVGLADSHIRAYGDWRNATKCWDVLPSSLIIEEAGYVITDVFGFEFSDGVFFRDGEKMFSKDGGLNRHIGQNFIAANAEDHEKLVWGENIDEGLKELKRLENIEDVFYCTWDIIRHKNIDTKKLRDGLSHLYQTRGQARNRIFYLNAGYLSHR